MMRVGAVHAAQAVHLRERVGPHGGPVVVDGGAQGAWLGGRGHVAVDVLVGEGARPGRLLAQGPACSAWKSRAAISRSGSHGAWKASMYLRCAAAAGGCADS